MTEVKEGDVNFFSPWELVSLGFKSVGKNVQISRKCSFYGVDGHIGNHVRIDDFCVFKGRINIGNHVHIACYVMVSGARGLVTIEDFIGLAAGTVVFTGSDDYSADTVGTPTIPREYAKLIEGPVHMGFGTMIGARVVILPNLKIGNACSVGAGCIVHESLPPGTIMRAPKSIIIPKQRNVHKVMEAGCRILENEAGEV